MSYRVYKSGIYTYRVWDASTGIFVVDEAKNLVLHNVTPRVDTERYRAAHKNRFQNSGDPLDYFAWLECEKFELKQEQEVFRRIQNVLFYNPFKHHLFRDKNTAQEFMRCHRFGHVLIEGNELRYTTVTIHK